MRIILFRHGPAGSRDAARWPADAERPLTSKGAERTARAARGLARVAPAIGAVLTSPLLRALRSAQLVREELGVEAPPEVLDALEPGGSFREVLARLSAFESGDVVCLVGHEPDLGKLAGVLVFGAPATTLPLKKAGACIIDFVGAIAPGVGRLHAFLPPRVLRRMAHSKSKV